jgi:tyrosine aminotransferase
MAIEIACRSLANPGENILIPQISWNYTTWLNGSGIVPMRYNLLPEKDWEIDLDHLESVINDKTRAIILNSPGNPCGNVFSKQHILEILKISEKHRLPIISDEIYEFFTIPSVEHHSVASLSENVPVLVTSGLTKRFLIPSIRLDWLIVNDRGDKLKNLRKGFLNVAGRNFFPNSTVQHALPNILTCVPQSFFDQNNERIYVSKKYFP